MVARNGENNDDDIKRRKRNQGKGIFRIDRNVSMLTDPIGLVFSWSGRSLMKRPRKATWCMTKRKRTDNVQYKATSEWRYVPHRRWCRHVSGWSSDGAVSSDGM